MSCTKSHVRLVILLLAGSLIADVPHTILRLKNFRIVPQVPPTMRVNSPLGALSNL